jgi:flagellar biosynthetic protein FlhB
VLAFVISRRRAGQYGGQHRSTRADQPLPDVPVAARRRRPAPAAATGDDS